MKRTNGFLNIEECKIIRMCDTKRDGRNCVAWLQYGEEEKLFKAGTEEDSISEVFWSYVLAKLQIKNVGYDLAKYNACYGVITTNYNPQKYESYALADIIYDYREALKKTEGKNYCFDQLYNLTDLKKAIDFCFGTKYDSKTIEHLKKEILELFLIQILLGNGDMHGHNGEIWFPNNLPAISPYYDFGKYGARKVNPFLEDYILDYEYQYEDEYEKAIPVFHNFLKKASPEELELYKKYMEKIRAINTKEIYEEMEDKIERKLPHGLKRSLTRKLYRNTKASDKFLK